MYADSTRVAQFFVNAARQTLRAPNMRRFQAPRPHGHDDRRSGAARTVVRFSLFSLTLVSRSVYPCFEAGKLAGSHRSY
jgi:hypothetical protein